MASISEKELIKAVKVSQELLKQKWSNDTFAFNKDCLHVEKGNNKVKLGKFHQEMCQFVDQYPRKQKLILVPRGHLKALKTEGIPFSVGEDLEIVKEMVIKNTNELIESTKELQKLSDFLKS